MFLWARIYIDEGRLNWIDDKGCRVWKVRLEVLPTWTLHHFSTVLKCTCYLCLFVSSQNNSVLAQPPSTALPTSSQSSTFQQQQAPHMQGPPSQQTPPTQQAPPPSGRSLSRQASTSSMSSLHPQQPGTPSLTSPPTHQQQQPPVPPGFPGKGLSWY